MEVAFALLAAGLVAAVYRRIARRDRAGGGPAARPPATPPNGALYGAPSVAPPAPGGLSWREINAARVEREARRG